MLESLHDRQDRFTAPGVSSILFAPPQQNYSLSAVSMTMSLVDALALEWFSGVNEVIAEPRLLGSWLTNTYEKHGRNPDSVTLSISPTGATSSVTLATCSETTLRAVPSISTRRFPFVNHYDLLKSPVEGLFFDPDDFVER